VAKKAHKAFVLVEMLMVIGLIALMAGAVMISFGAMWGNLRFKRQAERLVTAFQMAQNAAAESNRRYAVVLDFTEQAFILREFETLDLEMPDPQEAIIQTTYFDKSLTLDYVLYDDLEDTRDAENVTEARFLAGKSGWQYGGKVVLLDGDGKPWTIVVHRFAKPVELFEGDVEIYLPQYRENVPF
jgi:type II secretory pathway pseudopilin PulG